MPFSGGIHPFTLNTVASFIMVFVTGFTHPALVCNVVVVASVFLQDGVCPN